MGEYRYGTQAAYDSLSAYDDETLYIITDSQRIYKGSICIANNVTVPATLPNPHKLILTGSVSGEYDGSEEVTIDITTIKGDKGDKGDTGATGPEGPQGPQGIQGPAGYTPQRGVDYWTNEDLEYMIQAVIDALPNGDEVRY